MTASIWLVCSFRKKTQRQEGSWDFRAGGRKGPQEIRPDGNRYLILDNGYRYDGNPGQADYRAIKYDEYGVLLPKPDVSDEVTDRDAMTTRYLMVSDDLRSHAELQWRLSLPLLVFIVTLMAVPLSRVNPRQGRFLKLLPAILLYMAYLTILIAARGALEKGKIPPALGLWWVHGIFLLLVWACSTGSPALEDGESPQRAGGGSWKLDRYIGSSVFWHSWRSGDYPGPGVVVCIHR